MENRHDVCLFFIPIRVYLKTGNMTNSEGFFAC